jgi:hypothetical protein
MSAERCSSETAVQSLESHLLTIRLLRSLLGPSPLPFISIGDFT